MSKKDYDVDYAVEDQIERRRLQKEDDKRELKEMQKKNELADRLLQWVQNHEMIDKWYTDHGKDCLEAAKLIKSFQKTNHLDEWIELES